MNKTAVALIAKAPVAGRAKTRFCPPCTKEEAAAFALAFLQDTAALVRKVDMDSWCAYLGDEAALRTIVGDGFQLLAQRGSDLDGRLANAVDDLFNMGYSQVIVVGADCPTISPQYLRDAINFLDQYDVVIGPANDGGYVLLAQRVRDRRLYEGIEMSTEFVMAETIQRANNAGFSVKKLPVLHDLDTAAELIAAHQSGQLGHAEHTLAALQSTSAFAVRAVSTPQQFPTQPPGL